MSSASCWEGWWCGMNRDVWWGVLDKMSVSGWDNGYFLHPSPSSPPLPSISLPPSPPPSLSVLIADLQYLLSFHLPISHLSLPGCRGWCSTTQIRRSCGGQLEGGVWGPVGIDSRDGEGTVHWDILWAISESCWSGHIVHVSSTYLHIIDHWLLQAPYVAGQLHYCMDNRHKFTPVLLGFNPIATARYVS